jgi:hypothetical protein
LLLHQLVSHTTYLIENDLLIFGLDFFANLLCFFALWIFWLLQTGHASGRDSVVLVSQ